MASPSEFDIIKRYFSFSSASADSAKRLPVPLLGVGDDAAVLPPSDLPLIVATDTLNETVHFPKYFPARHLASRAMGVNLSDFAAMGARPRWITMALSLPTLDTAWLAEFSGQFESLCQQYQLALVGGDTTKAPLAISLTVIGEAINGDYLRRSGAQVGDDIWVSGSLGKGAAALTLEIHKADAFCSELTASDRDDLLASYYAPLPQLALGQGLLGLASAAIDISDGLIADANHIAEKSLVGLQIEAERLPIHSAVRCNNDVAQMQHWVLAGGDEYELLFTAPPAKAETIQALAKSLAVDCTLIGKVVEGSGVELVGSEWQSANQRGYQHF